jgi:hypothetical protein
MKMYIRQNFSLIVVLLLWALSVGSRFWANGIAFGLDYGIYQPDGANYAFRTLLFLGQDSSEAANQVVSWYQKHGFKNNIFDASFFTPDNETVWGLVAPRVLYSILSMPFVFAFGIPGLLVIPALSLLVLLLAILHLGRRVDRTLLAVTVVFGISVSPTVLRWMLANLTDSPLAALFALVVIILAGAKETRSTRFQLTALILLTSFTRFCLPIWIAIALVLFINSKRRDALIVLLASLVAAIPTFLMMPTNAVLPGSEPVGLVGKIAGVFLSFFKISFWEFAQLAVLDRVLLTLLVLALVFSIFAWREINSQYYVAVFLSVLIIGAINGTIGVNFRYQLPVLGFMAWVLISNSTKVRDRFLR